MGRSIKQSTAGFEGAAIAQSPSGQDARTRIIAVAEQLFAQRGMEAVSLREIASAAGQGNNNAVQYHFGSKDGLIQAIFRERLDKLDQRRAGMLAVLERQGRLDDCRALLDIMCLPLLDQVDQNGYHSYAGFLAHYLLGRRSLDIVTGSPDAWEEYPAQNRILDLLHQRISYVPQRIAKARIEGAVLSFFHLLVRADMQGLAGTDPKHFAALMEDALETMTVSLCAPYRHTAETQRDRG